MSSVYDRLLKVRESDNLKLKPCRFLKQTIKTGSGEEIPLQLRTYQAQMVYHMLLMKRFICGDDAGLGKCITSGHLIKTSAGLVRIEDMHEWADMEPETFEPVKRDWRVVVGVGGETFPVKNFYYGGKKPTIKVTTRYHFELEGTLVHPLLVWRRGEHIWVPMQELEEGDRLCVERCEDTVFPEEEPVLVTERAGETFMPPVLTSDLARFMGYYIGAGTQCSKSGVSLELRWDKEPEAREDVLKLIEDVFEVQPLLVEGSRLSVRSACMRLFLYNNGMDYCPPSQKTVPESILRSTKESNAEFLRGVFEVRGTVLETGGVALETASEGLARQLQIMLLRFGVVARRRECAAGKGREDSSWRLTLTGRDAHVFREQVGFVTQQKREALNDVLGEPAISSEPKRGSQYFYDPIIKVEKGEAEVFDIEVDDPRHCYVANGLMSHNTLETIATVCYLWEKEPDLRPVVVTTTSAMRQWGGEVDKFCNNVGWVLAEGSPAQREEVYKEFFGSWDEERPRFLITNYPRIRRDKRTFLKYAKGTRFIFIGDEITACKNTSSQTHHACKDIAAEAERVYGLTATLIKNNLVEGFGIFKVVHPEVFKTKTAFLNNYCVTRMQPIGGGRRVKVVVGHSRDHIALFKSKIDPYYLGRAKHDVAKELPVLTVNEMRIPMSGAQWQYYREALDGLLTINEGTEDEEEKETTKLTQLIYCQEIANDPVLIGNEGVSHKTETLLSMLEEDFADEKVIVFTRFRSMIDHLQEILERKGYKYAVARDAETRQYEPLLDVEKGFARVTGEEDSEERDAGRRYFTEREGPSIIFLTMAGAEAMNLQQARVMIFFDLPWSAGDYLQLVGRMIRIGSPHQNVYAVHMLSEGPLGDPTIDHHVTQTLNKKMGFIEGALGQRMLGQEGEDIVVAAGSDTGTIFDEMVRSAESIRES